MSSDLLATDLIEQMLQDYRRKAADLRAERRVLESLAKRLNYDLTGLDDSEEGAGPKQLSLKSDQFFGMTQTGAVAEFLRLKGKPATMEEILASLKAGGLEITGKDPKMNLYTQLLRATKRFVKLPSGEFGLLEWYPGVYQKRNNRKPKMKGGLTASGTTQTDEDEDDDEGEVEPDEAEDEVSASAPKPSTKSGGGKG